MRVGTTDDTDDTDLHRFLGALPHVVAMLSASEASLSVCGGFFAAIRMTKEICAHLV